MMCWDKNGKGGKTGGEETETKGENGKVQTKTNKKKKKKSAGGYQVRETMGGHIPK